ncbi:hypothetical protein ACOI91_10685 [Corynebacterium striatum]
MTTSSYLGRVFYFLVAAFIDATKSVISFFSASTLMSVPVSRETAGSS